MLRKILHRLETSQCASMVLAATGRTRLTFETTTIPNLVKKRAEGEQEEAELPKVFVSGASNSRTNLP